MKETILMHNPVDALLLGTAFAFIVQYMVNRETRLKSGWFILFTLSDIIICYLSGWIPLHVIGIIVWVVCLNLIALAFYRIPLPQAVLCVSTFIVLDMIVQVVFFLSKQYSIIMGFGQNNSVSYFPGNLFVIVLCTLFLLAWNHFSLNSLRRLYRNLYTRLENISPTHVVIIFIFLMIFMSMLGLLRIYHGMQQYSIEKVRFSFYILFLLLPVINLMGFLLYKLAIRNKIKLDEQKKEYEQLLLYTGIIEKLTRDMRAFRHDFTNILLTLRNYIEQNDTQGLKEYYFREILQNQSVVLNKNSIFLYIEFIKCIPLKGLLTTAFQRALLLNLNVSLLIDDYLEETGINTIDLCRIMGIFLDNAIEAAGDSDDKVLSISVIQDEARFISIITANSFGVKPEMNRLFQEGYSTKGAGRGMGLSTLQNILKNYEHVTLNTVIENNFFIQELNISQFCRK